MRTPILAIALAVSIGCAQGGAEKATSTSDGGGGNGSNPTNPASPSGPSHAGEYLVGRWVDQSDPSEVWNFYNDGTGYNEKCNHRFTWPKEGTAGWSGAYNFTITDTQSALNIAGCKPATGGIPSSRVCNHLKFSSTSMRFDCNFQALSHTFNKVP